MLLDKICVNSARHECRFLVLFEHWKFGAVEHDGERGQCRFPGDWKRSETVSAFFRGKVCLSTPCCLAPTDTRSSLQAGAGPPPPMTPTKACITMKKPTNS